MPMRIDMGISDEEGAIIRSLTGEPARPTDMTALMAPNYVATANNTSAPESTIQDIYRLVREFDPIAVRMPSLHEAMREIKMGLGLRSPSILPMALTPPPMYGLDREIDRQRLADSILNAEDERILNELQELSRNGSLPTDPEFGPDPVEDDTYDEDTDNHHTQFRIMVGLDPEIEELSDQVRPLRGERHSLADVIPYVKEHPGQSVSQISRALYLKVVSVSSFIFKECESGRIVKFRGPRGGYVHYFINDATRLLIENGGLPDPEETVAAPPRSHWETLMDDE